MTTLAYDGRTLAADKQATGGGAKCSVTKIFRVGELVIGFAGELGLAMEMLDWVRRGRTAADFPAAQRKTEDSCELVVIDAGRILVYERSPHAYTVEDPVYATGSGRDFAIAAMYCGLDARKAVAVACQFDSHSGMGVDAIDLLPPAAIA